jgi:hypothetical protein
MIWKSMPSGHGPMGGDEFSEKDHAQNQETDHDPIH